MSSAKAVSRLPPSTIPNEQDCARIGFLDLAPELRNRIYGFCLVCRRGKSLTSRRMRNLPHGLGVVVNSAERNTFAPNILATCKTIRDEATPVLYGANAFVVRNSGAKRFLQQCEEVLTFLIKHRQYIRMLVVIEFGTQGHLRRLLSCVEHMPSIARLSIASSCRKRLRTSNTLANALESLVRGLHLARKGQTEKPQALKVLHFPHDLDVCRAFRPGYRMDITATISVQDWRKLVNEVKQRLQKLLV